ncbi:MAG: AI-2E family transporter [Sphingomonas sp.]
MIRDGEPRNAGKAIVAILLVACALWIASDFLPALAWALVVAIAVDPLHRRLAARMGSRGGAGLAALVTAAVALLVIVPIAIGVVQAAREAQDVARWIAQARAHGLAQPGWIADLPAGRAAAARWWQANLATPDGAAHQFDRLDTQALLTHTRLVGSDIVHRSVIFAFTLIALFFLLKDRDTVAAQARRAGERLLGPSAERLARQVMLSVRGTIDGLVLVGIGVGAAMVPVYLLTGVPHPILLGAATAIAAMIPFGAALVFGLGALLLLAQGAVAGAIAVVAIGLAIVFVADHFIRPALIGGATHLPFLWVLIGILGGVESLGLLGLFVGPAVMAALMLLWRELVAPQRP